MSNDIGNAKCVYENDKELSKFLIYIKVYRKGIEYGEVPVKYSLGDKSETDRDMFLDIYISPKKSTVTNRKRGEIIEVRYRKELFNYSDDELIVTALDKFNSYYLD
jgi:hypothetical protein